MRPKPPTQDTQILTMPILGTNPEGSRNPREKAKKTKKWERLWGPPSGGWTRLSNFVCFVFFACFAFPRRCLLPCGFVAFSRSSLLSNVGGQRVSICGMLLCCEPALGTAVHVCLIFTFGEVRLANYTEIMETLHMWKCVKTQRARAPRFDIYIYIYICNFEMFHWLTTSLVVATSLVGNGVCIAMVVAGGVPLVY